MTYRVAMGGFLHETNTFAPTRATYADFVQGGGYMPMVHGDAMFSACRGINLGISGAVERGREGDWQMLPLLWAGAIPSAHVTQDAFEHIADALVTRLSVAGPLDGVFLDLHGAMVCEHLDDGEGELLARVREVVGPSVPVVACLDLHGNITARMVEMADMLVGFRTYPHVDMAETGRRAAEGLEYLMTSGTPPAKAFRRLDYLIPIPWQSTDLEPAASLYARLAELEGEAVISASLFMGFPAADFNECGPSLVAYGPGAKAALEQLATEFAEAEARFAGPVFSASEGVAEALQRVKAGAVGPVVLADTQDNPGAGGDSNTTGMLRALIEADAPDAALGLLVDPESALNAHAAGAGASLAFDLGGHSGVVGDGPYHVTATVETLSDGRLVAQGPYYGGASLNLGPSACLRIGGVRVVVTTHKAQLADREMFRFVGIEPETTDILVVKSSTHFRADFTSIAAHILICLAPGPMAFSPSDLPWKHLTPGMRLGPLGDAFHPVD
ncbi:M81 family metallopeptidase [Halomonas sp. ML-15]|uniref:M81 family metallopeptidase n=1 Tax=Halomonas sp. ML-15 TaxID=2773305 RepID=UPI0017464000|nr:M81 family metallopeptidase [Halomonas sp. ML-15]MBD3894487.1 M81 family metallopeptidase [Halomonas sp. ML-15]